MEGESAASPAKGTMAIGVRCSPPPVISIESCARARGAAKRHSRPSSQTQRIAKRLILLMLLEPIISLVTRLECKFQHPREIIFRHRQGQRRGLENCPFHGRIVEIGRASCRERV